jgi:hypothetical protein
MKRKMLLVSLTALVCFTLFAAPVHAQNACTYTFTSGTGGSYMQYCVTANGTLSEFQSPSGIPEIETGIEGYGICDATTLTTYYNWGLENYTNNWSPATLVSQTATAVTIARTTSDGLWTLTQTFTQVANGAPHLEIKMQVTNNSRAYKTVYLVRWTNVRADNTYLNNLDNTLNSAWGYFENGTNGQGLMVQNVPPAPELNYSAFAMDSTSGPSDVCSFTVGGPFTNTNGSIGIDYGFTINAKETKTATVNYTYF